MTTYKIETKGFDAISERLGRSHPLIRGGMNRMLRRVGRMLVPALKDNTPVRTGKLRASTRFQVQGSGDNQRLEVRQGARTETGVFYRPFVTDGTGPHEIRPVNRQALRFQIGGRTVFAKRVMHPGTRANPYHKRTVQEQRSEIQAIANEEARRLAQRVLN